MASVRKIISTCVSFPLNLPCLWSIVTQLCLLSFYTYSFIVHMLCKERGLHPLIPWIWLQNTCFYAKTIAWKAMFKIKGLYFSQTNTSSPIGFHVHIHATNILMWLVASWNNGIPSQNLNFVVLTIPSATIDTSSTKELQWTHCVTKYWYLQSLEMRWVW